MFIQLKTCQFGKALLLKATVTYGIKHGETELVPRLVIMVLEDTLQATKKKGNHQYHPAMNSETYNSNPPARYSGTIVTNYYGSYQPHF